MLRLVIALVTLVSAFVPALAASTAAVAQGISGSTDGPYSGQTGQPIVMSGGIDPAGLAVGEWTWDFGDGTIGSGQQVAKIYGTPGTYTVALTVRPANEGSVTTFTTASVVASSPPPPGANWLDSPQPAGWNVPGMPLPVAPAPDPSMDPRFSERNRNPETAADAALVSAGWQLFAPYQSGWGVMLVPATSGFDGMGRPFGYQVFAFVDDVYAGTLSPVLMASRFDADFTQGLLTGPDSLWSEFRRYTPADPLCCPSAHTMVFYDVAYTSTGPAVGPTSASTQPTGDSSAAATPEVGRLDGSGT
jgi:PKD repeat protein